MNRKYQSLIIDQFINSHKGVNNFGANEFEINGINFTSEEFDQRARELGWINGYKWGVEYPTNGKKPDLLNDVLVEFKSERLIGWNKNSVGYVDWIFTTSFRIVDERYKPKQPESHGKPSVNGAKGKPDKSWHERGDLPPVGVECEWRPSSPTNANWKRCVIDYIHGDRICVTNADSFKTKQVLHNVKFRPIKSEREKFVEAAVKAINKSGIEVYSEDTPYFLSLYDAGFKAPDEKSSS